MTVINVNPLSRKSIDRAQILLKEYKKTLEGFPELFVKEVQKELDSILKGEAPPEAQGLWRSYVMVKTSGGATSNDPEATASDITKTAEAVFVFEGQVEFIEFGTGIVGKNDHGDVNTDWLEKLPPPYTAYNRGPTIVHFEDENMDYWVYNDGGKLVRTQGQPANPFIYRSVQELLSKRAEIGKIAFTALGTVVPFE